MPLFATTTTIRPAFSGLELHERSRVREISAMKSNTSDWWFWFLGGILFGLYLDWVIVQTFELSSDASRYIGLFGLVGVMALVYGRQWALRKSRKNPPASTQS